MTLFLERVRDVNIWINSNMHCILGKDESRGRSTQHV